MPEPQSAPPILPRITSDILLISTPLRVQRLLRTQALCRADWVVILDEFQYFNRKSLSAFASLLQAEVDTLTGSSTGGIFVLAPSTPK